MPIYRRSPIALSRFVGGEVLLAMPGRSEVDRLSSTGAAAWELLEYPRSDTELVTALLENYPAALDAIGADVRSLLHELQRRGWIEEVSSFDG